MRERGKAVETHCNYNLPEYHYCSSDFPCRKHPFLSPVGVCAYCLRDRLINLVCSDCGEQRLSPCSCSEVSGMGSSVGRMSFLIKNEGSEANLKHSPHSKSQNGVRSEEVDALKRSGIWRNIAVRLFGKKRDKGCDKERRFVGGVSRSRSLRSFRDGSSDFSFSSAKISDVNGKSAFSEVVPRKSMRNVNNNRSFFPVKETELSPMDEVHESGFIDLKLGSSTESKTDQFSVLNTSGTLLEHHGSSFGGSCRITTKERGVQKEKKVHNRVWRWIFRAPS